MSRARRTGTATLPLHGGHAPPWLFERMRRLAPEVVSAIVEEAGPAEVLRRLSDPWWFQAFGSVLGFDWHSSGVTTVVCGALKDGLAGREADTGIWVAGGKGKTSRRTPDELMAAAGRLGLDGERLAYLSRMAAKVDTAAVQDGHQIYQHSFFLTTGGEWAVVQQGMDTALGTARRYHWLGERITALTAEPHAGVAADARGGEVLNLVAAESAPARAASARLAREEPARVLTEARRLLASASPPAQAAQTDLFAAAEAASGDLAAGASPGAPAARALPTFDVPADAPGLVMPERHWVDVRRDVDPARLAKVLESTYEAAPADFEALLALRGIGPKAVRALALLAEVVYGTPASVRDPARFSFAHGGKDGHPYPVDRPTYDHSIAWLRLALRRARMGRSERVDALKRLARWEVEQ